MNSLMINPMRVMMLMVVVLFGGAGCSALSSKDVFFQPSMDFSSIQAVAVMPFINLTGGENSAERVRDAFMSQLLATNTMYVLPRGEVARGLSKVGRVAPEGLSSKQIETLGNELEVEAIITGVVREYGEVRSGSSSANMISMSVQLIDVKSGRVVWSATSTKGGISAKDRLLGGGGEPMNVVTDKAVRELLDKLFD